MMKSSKRCKHCNRTYDQCSCKKKSPKETSKKEGHPTIKKFKLSEKK